SRRIQELVSRTEDHNRALREKASAITEEMRQGLSVDEFCALSALEGIDAEIEATERALAAAREQNAVRTTALFESIVLPSFDTTAIARILDRSLDDLDAAAEARVRAHVARLGARGEEWLADGMHRASREDME